MPPEPFRFRQFSVRHRDCGQPVCTDAILLGAWAGVDGASRVLDVGTGCGLLALMVAQRNPSVAIHAIDMDAAAIREAKTNFAASPWSSRLNADLVSFGQLLERSPGNEPYDRVISNPPWLKGNPGNAVGSRPLARMGGTLSPLELARQGAKILKPDGCLAMVMPTADVGPCVQLAQMNGLHLRRWMEVTPGRGKPGKRSLVEFGRDMTTPLVRASLVLMDDDGKATSEFRDLTKEFYLADPVAGLCLQRRVACDTLAGEKCRFSASS